MLKFVIKNQNYFSKIQKFKILNHFFIYDITKLDEVEDELMYNKIISSYSNNNNTSKYTYSNRFDDLNEILTNIILNKNTNFLNIHDVAISSGITTIELHDHLQKSNFNFKITGSDRFSEIYHKGNIIKYFYDIDGNLVQIYFFNLFLGLKITNLFFLSKMLFYFFKNLYTPKHNLKKILLIDKKFKKYINNSSIQFVNYDLFDNNQLDDKFDFIRVMNVLNLLYFTESDIVNAINKLKQTLKLGSFVLIGRTNNEGINNATFYKLENNHTLSSFYSINNGYEFSYLIK
jgi:chemotaxis methyl-accepting protein methylase